MTHFALSDTTTVSAMEPGKRRLPADFDLQQLIVDLQYSKREMDIARQQLNDVTDPMLIDHVILRLGAAEKRFDYLIQMARRMNVQLNGMRWDLEE